MNRKAEPTFSPYLQCTDNRRWASGAGRLPRSFAFRRTLMNGSRLIVSVFLLLAVLAIGQQTVFAQATTGTGSITGVVTDPQDAAVPGAKVTITNRDTGFSLDLSTNSSGVYNSGNLSPGNYVLQVSAPNFKTTRV